MPSRAIFLEIFLRWDEMRRDEMWWDDMTWHEMSWDEMRWDEMRWDEMRWDEMRWDEMRWVLATRDYFSLLLSSLSFYWEYQMLELLFYYYYYYYYYYYFFFFFLFIYLFFLLFHFFEVRLKYGRRNLYTFFFVFDTLLLSPRYPVYSHTEAIMASDYSEKRALLASGFRQVSENSVRDIFFLPCPLGTFQKPSSDESATCIECPPGIFYKLLINLIIIFSNGKQNHHHLF